MTLLLNPMQLANGGWLRVRYSARRGLIGVVGVMVRASWIEPHFRAASRAADTNAGDPPIQRGPLPIVPQEPQTAVAVRNEGPTPTKAWPTASWIGPSFSYCPVTVDMPAWK